MSKEDILEAYGRADEEQRLYLFLSHRDHRQAFMEIDTADARPAVAQAKSPGAVSGRDTSFRRAAACCWGWLKYCRSGR